MEEKIADTRGEMKAMTKPMGRELTHDERLKALELFVQDIQEETRQLRLSVHAAKNTHEIEIKAIKQSMILMDENTRLRTVTRAESLPPEPEPPRTKTVAYLERRSTNADYSLSEWVNCSSEPFDSDIALGHALHNYLHRCGMRYPWRQPMLNNFAHNNVIGYGSHQYRLRPADVPIDTPVAEVVAW